jgi:hypothetical protein
MAHVCRSVATVKACEDTSQILGSARVSRAGFGVAPTQSFPNAHHRRQTLRTAKVRDHQHARRVRSSECLDTAMRLQPITDHGSSGTQGLGRGCGVGRGLGNGVGLGVAVGVGLGVTVGVEVGVAVGVDVGIGVGVGVG